MTFKFGNLVVKCDIFVLKVILAVAQNNRLPFDRLRANGDILKQSNFSVFLIRIENPWRIGSLIQNI